LDLLNDLFLSRAYLVMEFFFWNLWAIGSFIPTGWASIFIFSFNFLLQMFQSSDFRAMFIFELRSFHQSIALFFSLLSVYCIDFSTMLIIFELMLFIQSIAFFSKQLFHISLFPLFFLRMDSFEIFYFIFNWWLVRT